MTLQEIKNQIPSLKEMTNEAAYNEGLKLLQELAPHRHIIDRNEYRALNNAIQDERFR